MPPCDYTSYLNSFINYEIKRHALSYNVIKLERVEHLLKLLGNPQHKLKCVHIAGTKGKGSTALFIAHILKAAGYSVGLYTSPHIESVRERIRILNKRTASHLEEDLFPDMITENEIFSLIDEYKSAFEALRETKDFGRLSYFEVLTALAFCYFLKHKVDVVILETGLGGRLDATNVVDALCSCLTPMSLEHTAQLGRTLTSIAREKSAIVKRNGQSVVVAPQPKEAMDEITRHCQHRMARRIIVGKDIHVDFISQSLAGLEFNLRGLKGSYLCKTKLLGRHQMINAACAIGIAEVLGDSKFSISDTAMVQGIQDCFWPCRFEVVRDKPYIILDAAHNGDSVKSLTRAVMELFPDKKVKLILGISQDKDIGEIVREILNIAGEVILTKADHPRAYGFKEQDILGMFQGTPFVKTNTVKEAVSCVLANTSEEDIILVTGSLFLAAEARGIFLKSPLWTVHQETRKS